MRYALFPAEKAAQRKKIHFLFPEKAVFFTVDTPAILLAVEPHLLGALDAFFPPFAEVLI